MRPGLVVHQNESLEKALRKFGVASGLLMFVVVAGRLVEWWNELLAFPLMESLMGASKSR
jgi:hypothetical protein